MTYRVSKLHPNDDDSFGFDWVEELEEGESITSSIWTSNTGVSLQDGTYSGAVTKVWIDDPGQLSRIRLVNEITTSQLMPNGEPRRLNATMLVPVSRSK